MENNSHEGDVCRERERMQGGPRRATDHNILTTNMFRRYSRRSLVPHGTQADTKYVTYTYLFIYLHILYKSRGLGQAKPKPGREWRL
jgi:hypothetical protein